MARQPSRRTNASRGACRTCKTCRRKKVKCEGQKPECSTCRARGWDCEYPQDGRKTAVRSKKADIKALQRQIEELKGQMDERLSPSNASSASRARPARPSEVADGNMNTPPDTSMLSGSYQESRTQPMDWQDMSPTQRPGPRAPGPTQDEEHRTAGSEMASSPEPEDNGTEMQVYGGTSLLHDRTRRDFWTTGETDDSLKNAARDRLIAHAVLTRQKEVILYSSPSITANIDFDGVPANLAMHLLDIHWNRLHLIYHQTYRPAIMDSLMNNGRYVSKLLLNAIYLQSSLYSDRDGLRLDAQDPRTTGMTFYKRFKELVVECIDQPTMPTVLGLLTCGTCLVAYGKQNAGWVYCGMAYRMMVDLGYHLNIPKTPEEGAKFGLTATDIEIRRRVYWGAYVSDKYQSLWLGRLPTLRESDSNAPQEYLDSLDEMAQWMPYVDPEAQTFPSCALAYQPRPCYALSTFQSLLRLCMIAAQVIDDLYSVKTANTAKSVLLQKKRELTARLTSWHENLPIHLQFDPDKDNALPPHQLNLHTTYHTLVILIEQAFLNRVHLDLTLDQAAQDQSRKTCIRAAFKIWKVLEAYKKTFTLRHAHYGEFYAAYSAILVVLQQAPQEHEEYIECIRFFWSMVSEPQRRSLGFGLGLKKPYKLLKSLMRRNNLVMQHVNVDEPENAQDASLPSTSPTWTDALLGWETGRLTNTEDWANLYHDTTDNMFLPDHAMFGLFTQ
ncbi:hypothetical protein CC79DRAFT_1320156 [Sarocladium strictum]